MGTQQAGPGPTFDAAAFTAALAVPAQNAAANVDAVDVVGNKTDTVAGTSIVSLARQVLALAPVPAQNAAANVVMRDVLGNKTDNQIGDSAMSRLYRLENHVHGPALCYPTQAAGITVVAGVGAWVLSAAFANVAPLNAIQNPFDIHSINVENTSANTTFELWLYYGVANTFAGMARFSRNAAGGIEAVVPFRSVIIPANSQIDCKLCSPAGAADSVRFTIGYNIY